jgi:hypothetical protein
MPDCRQTFPQVTSGIGQRPLGQNPPRLGQSNTCPWLSPSTVDRPQIETQYPEKASIRETSYHYLATIVSNSPRSATGTHIRRLEPWSTCVVQLWKDLHCDGASISYWRRYNHDFKRTQQDLIGVQQDDDGIIVRIRLRVLLIVLVLGSLVVSQGMFHPMFHSQRLVKIAVGLA